MPCLECKRPIVVYCRGLCQFCFKRPGVRDRYPQLKQTRFTCDPSATMTDAELDALIEERRLTMPVEEPSPRAGEREPEVPPIVRRLEEARRVNRRTR